MQRYNIYYKNNRINNRPLSENDLKEDILSNQYIYKKTQMNTNIKITVRDIKIVKCIIV